LGALTAIRSSPGRYESELSDRVESAARAVGIEADVCF
jgi:hypothetical protein